MRRRHLLHPLVVVHIHRVDNCKWLLLQLLLLLILVWELLLLLVVVRASSGPSSSISLLGHPDFLSELKKCAIDGCTTYIRIAELSSTAQTTEDLTILHSLLDASLAEGVATQQHTWHNMQAVPLKVAP